MKSILILFVMALMVTGCGSINCCMPKEPAAAPGDAKAAAERLLDVLKTGENFDQAIQQSIEMQTGMLNQMGLSGEELEMAQKSMDRSMAIVMEKFSWAKMKEMFIDIYAEVFTVEEMGDIIAFYESPQGQKFVAKQPELTRVTMQKMQGIMEKMMPEVREATEKMMAEMKASQAE